MFKQKKLIIIVSSALLLLAVFIGALALKVNQSRQDSEYPTDSDFCEKSENDLTDADFLSDGENAIEKSKSEKPDNAVGVFFDNYQEKTESELLSLVDKGINTVVFVNRSEFNDELIKAADFAESKGIYSGLFFDSADMNEAAKLLRKCNFEFAVITNIEEDKCNNEGIKSFHEIVKKCDSKILFGIEIKSNENKKTISQISHSGFYDFILVRQSGENCGKFQNNLNKFSNCKKVCPVFDLTDIEEITVEESEKYADVISAVGYAEKENIIFFTPYRVFSSAGTYEARTLINFIKTRDKSLYRKEFSVSNYDTTDFTVNESTVNFVGTSSPLYPLMCNNQKVKVASNGDFSIDFKLGKGKNTITFVQKEKSYTYNITYKVRTIKSVYPTNSITVPGNMEIDVEAVAVKGVSISVEFNGKTYEMTENDSELGDDSIDTGSDFTVFSAKLKTPTGKKSEQKLGKYKVYVNYNGQTETVDGAEITVSPDEPLKFKEIETPKSTKRQTSSSTKTVLSGNITTQSSIQSADGPGRTRAERTREDHTRGERTRGSETTESTTNETTAESYSSSVINSDKLQRYSYLENYGLGTAKICEVIDDYVEVYPGTNTATYSNPDCSPLLKGTTDYVKSIAYIDDSTYYYLESGVKVPLRRQENMPAGRNTSITHIRVTDGYVMPSNKIRILSCGNSNGNTIIKLEMNRNVAFNSKLLGQSYSEYKSNRFVSVSAPDCTGLEFTFSDTINVEGSFSFMNSVIKSAHFNTYGNTSTITFNFAHPGKFFGYHYEYDSNNNLVIIIKNKPGSLEGYRIMLDPGHGGYDPGAGCCVSSGSWSEESINLSLANKIKSLLEAEGATVIMTRTENSMVSLSDRNRTVRNKLPDLFISIHCDAASSSRAYGTSAFYYRAYSQPLAKYIHEELVSTYKNDIYGVSDRPNIDRGISFYPYKVTRVEECPAVLIEYGFVTNLTECQALQNSSVRDKLALATVRGIKKYVINT